MLDSSVLHCSGGAHTGSTSQWVEADTIATYIIGTHTLDQHSGMTWVEFKYIPVWQCNRSMWTLNTIPPTDYSGPSGIREEIRHSPHPANVPVPTAHEDAGIIQTRNPEYATAEHHLP